MITFHDVLAQLTFNDQCRKFGIPLWQCPHFLFFVMGMLIIVSILIAYALGSQLVDDPFVVNLIILGLTASLITIAFIITHSFEKLAEANRLKSEFVGIVSHQLRTPLTNFIWALDFLNTEAKEDVTEKQEGYFHILEANADRMKNLVNELLTVSRIQEGTLPLYKQEFSFVQLVNVVVSEFSPLIRASNIKLVVEGGSDLPNVYSDPARLRNVVSNLLDNAIKYTKKAADKSQNQQEQPVITLRYEARGDKLYFEIQDQGIGIPRNDEKYIFQRFFRSSNVLKHETQGSGLGLYIAKSIVEKADGEMGFHSEEYKGSTFWFTVPFATHV
ncbi:MAG: HAMP domain-containing histidine kinase [Candidatus Wildermuthbacteria bacterium]|nr:HAMP domain-containing histidine kinase [Candidatus Wildermuthbacteria bacterium]